MATLAKLADSPNIWASTMGLLFARTGDPEEGERRLLAAIRSGDDVKRTGGLLGAVLGSGFPRGAPLVDEELKAELRAALAEPVFVENLLAAQAVARWAEPEEVVQMIVEATGRSTRPVVARVMLQSLRSQSSLHTGTPQERADAILTVLEPILAAKDSAMEKAFVDAFSFTLTSIFVDGGYPILETLLKEAQPETFVHILGHAGIQNVGFHLSHEAITPVVLERLGELCESRNPATRRAGALGLGSVLSHARVAMPGRADLREDLAELTRKALGTCFQGDAEEVEAGFALLKAWLDSELPQWVNWQETPSTLKREAAKALGYANDRTHGRSAAEWLAALYRDPRLRGRWDISADAPDLAAATSAARDKVMSDGTAEDHVIVLCGMAEATERDVSEQAFAELERRLLAGEIPEEMEAKCLEAMATQRRAVGPAFLEYALARLGDANKRHAVRSGVVSLLLGAESQFEPLFATLENVAAERPLTFDFARLCLWAVANARTAIEGRGEPLPAWIAKGAEIGIALAQDKGVGGSYRASGLRLYGAAKGRDAAETLEATLRDGDQDLDIRRVAASLLPGYAPTTRIYGEMLKEYEALPPLLRESLGLAAAQSPEAEGAEAFVIAVIKDSDQEMQHQRSTMLFQLKLPATPELLAALEEAKADRYIGHAATQVLRRFDEGPRGRGEPGVAEAVRSYARQVEQLQDADWKEKDTVQENLTWYFHNGQLVVADSAAGRVERFGTLFGLDQLRFSSIAFGQDKVWLGTDKGLVAYDREGTFWNRFAVDARLVEVEVTDLKMTEDGKLRVAVFEEGRPKWFEYDLKRKAWGDISQPLPHGGV